MPIGDLPCERCQRRSRKYPCWRHMAYAEEAYAEDWEPNWETVPGAGGSGGTYAPGASSTGTQTSLLDVVQGIPVHHDEEE